jgi:pimeloyl-ACP methyl ester carboxylesterase
MSHDAPMSSSLGTDNPDVWVASGQADLAVSVWGVGVPLLALHAGVCDRRSWQWCATTWAEAGYRTIAYDRRGFGSTRCQPEPHDDMADLRAVTGHTDARPAVVLGNSMGGTLALDLALAHPDEVLALVLIGSLPSGVPVELWRQSSDEAAAEARMDAAQRAGDLDELNRWEVQYWLDGPAQTEGRVQGIPRDLMHDMNGQALRSPSVGPAAERSAAWPRLHEITVPTLLVVGDLDEQGLAPVTDEVAGRLGDARVEHLPDSAHCPMLDRPAALSAAVLRFLRDASIA